MPFVNQPQPVLRTTDIRTTLEDYRRRRDHDVNRGRDARSIERMIAQLERVLAAHGQH